MILEWYAKGESEIATAHHQIEIKRNKRTRKWGHQDPKEQLQNAEPSQTEDATKDKICDLGLFVEMGSKK